MYCNSCYQNPCCCGGAFYPPICDPYPVMFAPPRPPPFLCTNMCETVMYPTAPVKNRGDLTELVKDMGIPMSCGSEWSTIFSTGLCECTAIKNINQIPSAVPSFASGLSFALSLRALCGCPCEVQITVVVTGTHLPPPETMGVRQTLSFCKKFSVHCEPCKNYDVSFGNKLFEFGNTADKASAVIYIKFK